MKIQVKGISGGRDRRGLVTLTLNHLFTESSITEALTAEVAGVPGLPEVGRQFKEWDVDNNGFLIAVTFEGVLREPGAQEEQFSIKGEWREEAIEAFPYRSILEEKYGAYVEDGRLKFSEYLEGASSGGTGLGGSNGVEERNPLFGVTTYPVQRLVATHSYVRKRVPASVYSSVGRIVKTLPAGFDNPPKRTWVKEPPQTRKRGNAAEIVETWKEVDNLKHLEALQLLLTAKGR